MDEDAIYLLLKNVDRVNFTDDKYVSVDYFRLFNKLTNIRYVIEILIRNTSIKDSLIKQNQVAPLMRILLKKESNIDYITMHASYIGFNLTFDVLSVIIDCVIYNHPEKLPNLILKYRINKNNIDKLQLYGNNKKIVYDTIDSIKIINKL